MKVLVTGMTSAQANPERSKATGVTNSWLFAEILRSAGHEVDHRTPSLSDTCEEYDAVLCGVQAPHAVGSNRIYGALNVIGRAEAQGKLTLFVDDLEMNKILGGMRVMRNDPDAHDEDLWTYTVDAQRASLLRRWNSHTLEREIERQLGINDEAVVLP